MLVPVLVAVSMVIAGFTILPHGASNPSVRQVASQPAGQQPNPWGDVKIPSSGKLGPIGGYSAGCLDGAQTLAKDGPGFQKVRLSRNRQYGHESLMRFITDYTSALHVKGIGTILIGDMSQPRGGPMTSGHASHQIGLDFDIWFWLNPVADQRPLTPEEREELSPPSLVNLDKFEIDRDVFRPEHMKMLRAASENPAVERIFVNPVIKKEVCETAGSDRTWLRKLRPWWGHNYHFHVRLKCPDGSNQCRHQEAVPPGDGCGEELNWWFAPENREPPTAEGAQKLPELPAACAGVLKS